MPDATEPGAPGVEQPVDLQGEPAEPSLPAFAPPPAAAVAVPPARRRGGIALLIAVVVLGILGVCGLGIWGITTFATQTLEEIGLPLGLPGEEYFYYPDGAFVTYDGRFAIINTSDVAGEPQVVAVDIETGEAREAQGYTTVAVERAPVLWLTPMNAEERGERLDSDLMLMPGMGPFDEPPSGLEAWELDEGGSEPSPYAPARWRPVAGAADWIAYLEIDVLRGSQPARLLFNNSASSGEGHKAALPEDFGTFAFRGFSPSGDYVALEELTQVGEAEEAISGPEGEFPERRLIIVRAADGNVVAETILGDFYADIGPAQWAPDSDRVVWVELVFDEGTGEVSSLELKGLDPNGEELDMLEVWDIEPPGEWHSMMWAALAGVDRSSEEIVVLTDETSGNRIWTLGPGGITDRGSLPWGDSSASYREGVGFIQMETEFDNDGTSRSTAVTYDLTGGSRKVLWRGREMAGDGTW